MGLTVPNDSLSTAIIRDLFRDGIRAATGVSITDPEAARRPPRSPLVVSELPDRDRHYPHIIVGESADVSGRIDIRGGSWRHRYSTLIEIHAKSSTQMYRLRDQVRGWIENNVATLTAAGFVDAEIVSSSSMTWDGAAEVRSWRIVVQGLVYTAPSEE